ncbi:unnamed protein product [Didymodactylos carnosus]|uniref:Peptidase A1 domain-containing protein n=1 Tax=Didymodactylos carnosus TaxID=1234261 RepID=A0A814CTB2_9BILA|nr:unnamed protein product [Didymodactylos carnosus]CAF0961478.1 unnamed protein product [Didymodactylos carnosus]CAF3721264.1 unnamed protein product [Didymodactylos carnosus]CAF3734297.1 unnamed protein product [Didymodactylos carnosus]
MVNQDGAYSGVVGLAYPKLTTYKEELPLFYNLWKQKKISLPLFSVFLTTSSKSSLTSELVLGGIDKSKYTGSITYVQVSPKGYWEFKLTNVMIGRTVISGSKNTPAISDTGTTYIYGPSKQVKAFYAAINAYQYDNDGDYGVDCEAISSLPSLTFTISGVPFTLLPQHYIYNESLTGGNKLCLSAISASTDTDNDSREYWLLGDSFLQRFYSVYNMGTNQVGFAKSVLYKS